MNGVENNKVEEKTEQKEQLAKEYGLNLEQIKHIKLDNGKEFFEFINPKNKQVKMVENIDYKKGLKEQYEDSQETLAMSKGDDASENAENTFKHNLKYKNKETELVSLEEYKNNRYHYSKKIRELDTITKNKIIALLYMKDQLKLEYFNIENGIGVNDQQEVIDVKYDFVNNKAEFVNPLTISYNNSLQDNQDLDFDDVDLSSIDIDGLLDQLEISDVEATVSESKKIDVSGVTIDSKVVAQVYDTPEILDRDNTINKKQRTIYKAILDRLLRKKNIKQTKKNQKQLVYKKKDNNKAA